MIGVGTQHNDAMIDWVAPVNWLAPLNRGLVGWWKAIPGATGGLNWMDLARRNHGTLTNGPTWTAADNRPGGYGSVYFSNTNHYIDIPSHPALSNTGAVSVSAWVKGVPTLSNFSYIAGNGVLSNAGYGIHYNASALHFYANVYSNSATATFTADSLWHHVVGSYDSQAGANQMRIWLDGVEGTARTYTTAIAFGGCSPRISHTGASFTRWNGYIDDVRFWNRGLSGPEAVSLYHASRTGYQAELRRTLLPKVWQSVAATGNLFRNPSLDGLGGAGKHKRNPSLAGV